MLNIVKLFFFQLIYVTFFRVLILILENESNHFTFIDQLIKNSSWIKSLPFLPNGRTFLLIPILLIHILFILITIIINEGTLAYWESL